MIPVVFDAMMEVVREEALPVEYIRLPREYLGLYLPSLFRFEDFSPINMVKVAILNILVLRARLRHGAALSGMEKRIFLGVFLSGRMYQENVALVYDRAVALARRKGMGLELLAHPGSVEEPEDIDRLTSPEDRAFLTSPLRKRETSLFLEEESCLYQAV